MIDGPYETLNARPHWQKVAKRVAKSAYGPEEVLEQISVAVQKDFQQAPLDALYALIRDTENDNLLTEHETLWEPLETLLDANSGSVEVTLILEGLNGALAKGERGQAAWQRAMRFAVEQTVDRQLSGIQTHFRTQHNGINPQQWIERLGSAKRNLSIDDISGAVIESRCNGRKAPTVIKHIDVEDGPKLCQRK